MGHGKSPTGHVKVPGDIVNISLVMGNILQGMRKCPKDMVNVPKNIINGSLETINVL
jgi:hypothetical protein